MKPLSENLALVSLGALIVCSTTGVLAQTLAHRYSFNDPLGSGTFADSVGGETWNGTLVGPAWLDGSQLQMAGDGGFGSMPGSMISGYSQVTIELWGSFSELNPVWTRVFSFGDQNGSGQKITGLDYCHYAGGDWQNLGLTTSTGNIWANNPGGLNGQNDVHITVVVDPVNNQMYYYNGTTITSNPGINGGTTVPALNTLVDTFAVIGKSLFDVDPTLAGSINEFRVYNGVLSPARVALNEAAGPDNYITDPGALVAVHLNSPSTTLSVNEISKQAFTGDFANVTNVDLVLYGGATFTSGNTDVFTVSANGTVTALAQGSAALIASFGGKSATNILNVVALPAVLKHRYSFASDANDSIGGAHGILVGSATVSGGKAVLDGSSSCYIDLPGPTINLPSYKAATIEAWVDFGAVEPWSRLWNFGHDDASSEIYLAPRGPGNGTQHRLSENFSGGRTIDWGGALSNQTAQITAVIDPLSGTLSIYKNGILEYATYDASSPLSLVSNTMAVIGRSLVGADPYMPGSIDEFRIYSGALTPEEIALTYANGPASLNRDPGALQSIEVTAMTYPANAGRMAPVIRANYANLPNFPLYQNSSARVTGLSLTSSDTNVIAILANNMIRTFGPGEATLTATYRGKTSSTKVKVSNVAQLAHRYSFAGNYNDSVGTAHGQPQGATSVADGKLVLDGFSDTYLQLPAGMLKSFDAVTIDTWVNFNAGQTWARLWYFGDDRGNEFYVAPVFAGGGVNHIFSAGFPMTGSSLERAGRWENQALHITCVYGNGTMAIYTNGVLHASAVVNGRTDQIGTAFSWIGRSPYPDPFMNCTVDEFRVYKGRLSEQEIQASALLGPDALLSIAPPQLSATITAGQAKLRWPAAAAGFAIQASSNLNTWTTLTNTPALVGSEWELTAPAGANSAQFFRLWR